jgi:hypothetical protein
MSRISSLAATLSLLALMPLAASATPSESGPVTGAEVPETEAKTLRPLQIEIVTDLNFSRAALIGKAGGEIKIAAQQSGQTSAIGVVDLGGYAMAGQVRIYGEPGNAVRIDLPRVVRMTSSNGGVIEISDIRTNLSPTPRLDMLGQISFAFGGRLTITGNASGAFRGRIPITAEYE